MVDDEVGREFHDRATRGLPLMEQEWEQLTDWYAAQDRNEHIALPADSEPETIDVMRAEVQSGTRRLLAVAQRIQDLSDQNDALRGEIVALQQRLARGTATRSA